MSKLSFRARALDSNKSLPVYHAEDIPDLSEYSSVNRVVPQMPTGMEKEEETVGISVYFFHETSFVANAALLVLLRPGRREAIMDEPAQS